MFGLHEPHPHAPHRSDLRFGRGQSSHTSSISGDHKAASPPRPGDPRWTQPRRDNSSSVAGPLAAAAVPQTLANQIYGTTLNSTACAHRAPTPPILSVSLFVACDLGREECTKTLQRRGRGTQSESDAQSGSRCLSSNGSSPCRTSGLHVLLLLPPTCNGV